MIEEDLLRAIREHLQEDVLSEDINLDPVAQIDLVKVTERQGRPSEIIIAVTGPLSTGCVRHYCNATICTLKKTQI